jgi:hypothetical protein
MALGNSDITTIAVNTELLNPYSPAQDMLLSVLSAHANAGNIASFLGPGTLAVDASKNVYWIAPTNNYKLGDFRGYNRTATAPSASPNFTQYWGPGGSGVDISIATLPQQMNLFFIDSGAIRIYYKGYLTTANRTAETSPWDTQLSTVLTSSVTPLTGHTRTQTSKPQHPHVQTFSSFVTTGLTTPTDYIYLDTFFASTGGARLVNLGNAIANGYTTITMIENQQPYAYASGNTSAPSGYTAAFPVIHSASTRCTDSDPTYSTGGTNITFYFGINGINGAQTRHLGTTATTIRITYDGSTKDVNIGAIGTSQKVYVSTTLPGSKTWAYNKSAAISVVSKTYSGSYYVCP